MSKEFKDLIVSTMTVVVYYNMRFDLPLLFERLPITIVDIPLTKKKKHPNLKKITADRGSVLSLRMGNNFRGIQTKLKRPPEKSNPTYFLNQITAIISVGDKNLNTMIFKDKMKIVGNKTMQHAYDAVHILWGMICDVGGAYEMMEGETSPRFVFDPVMTNVDFKLGFKIDRKKLNNLMNMPEIKKNIYLSRFETTENTNVNIKIPSTKPEDYFFYQIEASREDPEVWIKTKVRENAYNTKPKKKQSYTTFLVFRSSKVIESGKYLESMRDSYDYFIDLILFNRKAIEEIISTDDAEYVHEEA